MASSISLGMTKPTATTKQTVYTVPPQTYVLLTSVTVMKRGAGTALLTYGIERGSDEIYLLNRTFSGSEDRQLDRPWVVMTPADKLITYQSVASSMLFTASGLAFPAP